MGRMVLQLLDERRHAAFAKDIHQPSNSRNDRLCGQRAHLEDPPLPLSGAPRSARGREGQADRAPFGEPFLLVDPISASSCKTLRDPSIRAKSES